MRLSLLLGCIAFLAACGVDGAPQPPATKAETPAGFSGTFSVGVAG